MNELSPSELFALLKYRTSNFQLTPELVERILEIATALNAKLVAEQS